jgi:hypothetical protein
MLNVKLAEKTTLADVIKLALSLDTDSDEVRDEFPCVYSKFDPEILESQLECILEKYPVVVSDKEIYPDFVVKGGYSLLYYGQGFIDVIDAARSQLDSESVGPYLEALNYYRENDDFLDFSDS